MNASFSTSFSVKLPAIVDTLMGYMGYLNVDLSFASLNASFNFVDLGSLNYPREALLFVAAYAAFFFGIGAGFQVQALRTFHGVRV